MDLLRSCYSSDSDSLDDDDTDIGPRITSKSASSGFVDKSDDHGKTKQTPTKDENTEPSHLQADVNSKNDFFSLNESYSSEDENDDIKRKVPKKDEAGKLDLTGDFWSPKGPEIIPWEEPDKIWKCNLVMKPSEENTTESLQYIRKRPFPRKAKRSIQTGSNNRSAATPQPKPMTRSPFFIHHKVAPFLHQSVSNKTPRSPSSKGNLHVGCVNSVSWCSQPEHSHLLLSASHDKTIRIWNAFSKDGISCLQTISGHEKGIRAAQWITGGRNVLSASFDKTARIFDIERGTETTCFRHSNYVSAISVHPVNNNYFLTGSNNCLQCWDVRVADKCMKKFTYKDKFGQVEDIAMMNNGVQFFTCNDNVTRDSSDRNIMAWDFNKGVVLSNQIYQERYTCTKLALHPNQSQLIAQTKGDYMALFSTIRPYKLNKCKRFEGHKVQEYKVGCDFSPDGRMIASGSADGNVYLYDFESAKFTKKIGAASGAILPVNWHPVLPSVIACGSDSGSVIVLQ